MSRDSLNIPKAERWKMHCGMTPSDCKALVAVLSHYNVTRKPVTGPQVAKFLLQLGELRNAALGPLERRGWIRAVGKVRVSRCSWAAAFVPTDRGYSILGLEKKPSKAA